MLYQRCLIYGIETKEEKNGNIEANEIDYHIQQLSSNLPQGPFAPQFIVS
jgi:hypothetical protein